jgi:hypothetical protein
MAAPISAAIAPPSTGAAPAAQRPHDEGVTDAPGESPGAPASGAVGGSAGGGAGGVLVGGVLVGGALVPGMAVGAAPTRRFGMQCLAREQVALPGQPPCASQALSTMLLSNVWPPAQPPRWVTVSTRTQSGNSTQAIASLGGLTWLSVRSESKKLSQSASA